MKKSKKLCKLQVQQLITDKHVEYMLIEINSYKKYQPLIDGGLYAMNFDMGLHLNNIGFCFKMFVREPKIEKEFKQLTQIPKSEIPIVLILAGHYPKHSIKSPKSVRINENNLFETVSIH